MTNRQLLSVLILGVSLSACGGKGTKPVDCEEASRYQNYVEGKRVVAPDDMDQLSEFAEMPIPKADPGAAPTAPGKCIDMPPSIKTS